MADAWRTAPLSTRELTARQRQIVDVAAPLFDERGYDRASMEDIAAAIGIRKASLYHHFRSKDEILYWIHEEFIDLLIRRHRHRLDSAELSPAQQLLEVQADIMELMDTHRGHVRVFFEHHRELSSDYRQLIEEKRRTYQAMVEGAVAAGVEKGEFRQVDATITALALFGMCNWAYQWYRQPGALTSRQVAMSFWDLMMRGLRADGTADATNIGGSGRTQDLAGVEAVTTPADGS